MNLEGFSTIEDWFINSKFDENSSEPIFPHNNFNYITRYSNYKNILNKWIHPYVVQGAIITDGGCLNDHGPEHIKKVIYYATQLLKSKNCDLTRYEVYILLMAIHLHDVGNIFGRRNHELNSLEVIKKLGNEAGEDRIEWDFIFEIAEAHGGTPKDKISELSAQPLLGFEINIPLLAAILKFSDELSDDRTRANNFQLQCGILPVESEIFHQYSYSLHTVQVDLIGKQIKMSFDIEEDILKKLFPLPNSGGKKYLLDEIYERTFKTHNERLYCMRFLRPHIEINRIRVLIVITLNRTDERNKRQRKKIQFDLGEVGYPGEGVGVEGFFNIAPKLKSFTAKEVIKLIKNNQFEDVAAIYQ